MACMSLSSFAGGEKSTTQSIQGIVTDKQGNPLVGAKVTIDNSDISVYTDFDGHFMIDKVSKTEHTLSLSHISFENSTTKIDSQASSEILYIELSSK